MASVQIRARTLRDGRRRYDVQYRRGGRGYRLEHAGTFPTKREATIRRDVVAGWLAAGLDPRRELARLTDRSAFETVRSVAARWLAGRVDLSDRTRAAYRSNMTRIIDRFGSEAAAAITPADVTGWVADLSDELAPGTVGAYLRQLRMILDDLPENPARHRSVRLPRQVRVAPEPPDADELLAMLGCLPARYRPAAVLLEQTALRVSEAIGLQQRDIDPAGRIRVRAEVSKTKRARWVDVPDWLAGEVRPLRGVERTAMGNAMRRASERAKVPRIHPHLLRHRRATLWHQQGVVAVELARRLGHSKASTSLDLYAQVRPLVEAHPSRLLEVLVEEP